MQKDELTDVSSHSQRDRVRTPGADDEQGVGNVQKVRHQMQAETCGSRSLHAGC